jgi:hypothetical protein
MPFRMLLDYRQNLCHNLFFHRLLPVTGDWRPIVRSCALMIRCPNNASFDKRASHGLKLAVAATWSMWAVCRKDDMVRRFKRMNRMFKRSELRSIEVKR